MPALLRHSAISLFLLLFSTRVLADGSRIDRVYDPYVQYQEQEIEYRALLQQDSSPLLDNIHMHKFGYGASFTDNLFAEVYLVGSNAASSGVRLEATEVELKWQLTEQGQYSSDWGMLFELEHENDTQLWEASSTLILLHEWNRWIALANMSLIYEWGGESPNELETAFSGQLRYRYSERLEPAIEFYQAQDTEGIGPVLAGLLRLGQAGKIYWRTGVIAGLDATTPDFTWLLSIEYEFR